MDHISILRRSINIIDQKQKENPMIIPDVQGATLQGIDWQEAKLWRADFRRKDANLRLQGVNLQEAILEGKVWKIEVK